MFNCNGQFVQELSQRSNLSNENTIRSSHIFGSSKVRYSFIPTDGTEIGISDLIEEVCADDGLIDINNKENELKDELFKENLSESQREKSSPQRTFTQIQTSSTSSTPTVSSFSNNKEDFTQLHRMSPSPSPSIVEKRRISGWLFKPDEISNEIRSVFVDINDELDW
ncbi:569_t:CDS:2 [Diversispora eburnea]|uniref:569_t:CDS:1 n=1 Tax=Diversispora eburnea TaxID=1213867 RepID=A0A9N9B9W3_9GLOM|nr:569_t:CDS:2 [Diversispora eburnea]